MITKGFDCVFIPTAGIGSRLNKKTKYLNKSLVPINNKPIIAHIIDKLPKNIKIVVALGYKGDLVRDYLSLAYNDRFIQYSVIWPFEGADSGLGVTLLQSQSLLQKPFIFWACDSLLFDFKEKYNFKNNWIGMSKDTNPKSNFEFGQSEDMNFRSVVLTKNNKVNEVSEKGVLKKNSFPYIGIAGIKDYKNFWKQMNKGNIEEVRNQGEVYGINKLIRSNYSKFNSFDMNWIDTGNLKNFEKAKAFLDKNTFNILPKEDEEIYHHNDKIIKFNNDPKFISDRYMRSKILKGYVPRVIKKKKNFYSYKYYEGDVLSSIIDEKIFNDLLIFFKKFWRPIRLSKGEKVDFLKSCNEFYNSKTKERINLYNKSHNTLDQEHIINGSKIPKLTKLFNQINWKDINNGIPVRFHGDLHFENIILGKQFKLLDWRQSFAGNLKYGDLFYDLAKLKHGMYISHKLINNNLYEISVTGQIVNLEYLRSSVHIDIENRFDEFCIKNKINIEKVNILTSLIFLNIAALHHYPYSKFLYFLGKKFLYNTLYRK